MKGLTLTQPWASAVALGHKKVETRSWRTSYTGPIAIHAAKGYPEWAREFAAEERAFGRLTSRIPLSAIVATAALMGCRATEDVAHQVGAVERRLGDYATGRWAWFLSDIVALREPVFCRGSLGLWTMSPDLISEVKAATQEGK